MRHSVPRIVRQCLSQHLFGFLIAILGQKRPCLAKAAEAGLTSGRRRPAETTDRLVAVSQFVDQSASAEPRLAQGWEQLSGAIVRNDGSADVALLFQSDSQAEICVAVARVDSNGPLQCRDGIRYASDLEAGEAEIVLDGGIKRFEQRCIAQRRDRFGWSAGSKRLSGQRKQRRHLRQHVWVSRPNHFSCRGLPGL